MNNRSQSGLAKKVDNAFSLEKKRSISCKKSLPKKAYRLEKRRKNRLIANTTPQRMSNAIIDLNVNHCPSITKESLLRNGLIVSRLTTVEMHTESST